MEKNDFDKAIRDYNNGLQIAEEYGLFELRLHAYEQLSRAYENTGQLRLAINSSKTFQSLKDTLINRERLRSIADMETKYRTEQKEKQIAIQELNLSKISNRNRILFLGLLLAIVIVLSTIASYIFRMRAKRAEDAVIKERHENEINQIELKAKKSAFVAFSNGQEQERKRIAEELHDDIGASLAGIQLKMETDNENKTGRLSNQLKNISNRIRDISHDLMPPTIQDVSLHEVMEDYLEDFAQGQQEKVHFHYHKEKEARPLSDQVKLNLFRILQESLQNIAKHAEATNIDIQCHHFDERFNLIIEDDGKGITVASGSKGIGLQNMESRVNLLDGQLSVDSAIGRGTIINVLVPVEPAVTT